MSRERLAELRALAKDFGAVAELVAEIDRLRDRIDELEAPVTRSTGNEEPCTCGWPWGCDRKVHTADLAFPPKVSKTSDLCADGFHTTMCSYCGACAHEVCASCSRCSTEECSGRCRCSGAVTRRTEGGVR